MEGITKFPEPGWSLIRGHPRFTATLLQTLLLFARVHTVAGQIRNARVALTSMLKSYYPQMLRLACPWITDLAFDPYPSWDCSMLDRAASTRVSATSTESATQQMCPIFRPGRDVAFP